MTARASRSGRRRCTLPSAKAPPNGPRASALKLPLVRLSAVAAAFFALFVGISSTAAAYAPGPVRAEVFCGGANSLVYRFRPRACHFHDHNFPMSGQVGYTLTRRLHWAHWGPRSATANGEIEYPMVGWSGVRIRLSDPRAGCGRTVFTMAKLHAPGRTSGVLKIPLDRCPLSTE
jgi:hypothetical protein